jgi:hypothetical protein
VRDFPPFPTELKGRRRELSTLARMVAPHRVGAASRLALVGGGGSGKSVLASALGYRVRAFFPGGIHWFRSGPWDERTLGEMLAIRFKTSRTRSRLFASLRTLLSAMGPTFVVLDNHENDLAAATLLNELEGPPVTWLITARRCLLGGVRVFPVVAPLAISGGTAFSRVKPLAGLLRQGPLALAMADGIVRSGASSVDSLRAWLLERGVDRVRVIAHEDDLPEVALLVEWAWPRLSAGQVRVLSVLAHMGGDHMDTASLSTLARVRSGADKALAGPLSWGLVQRPLPGRYALHAVVRYAISRRTQFDQTLMLLHYVDLLERWPARLDLEQTHLYASMDYAHGKSNMGWMLRIDRLMAALAGGP